MNINENSTEHRDWRYSRCHFDSWRDELSVFVCHVALRPRCSNEILSTARHPEIIQSAKETNTSISKNIRTNKQASKQANKHSIGADLE